MEFSTRFSERPTRRFRSTRASEARPYSRQPDSTTDTWCRLTPEFFQLSLPRSALRRSRSDSASRPLAAVGDGLVHALSAVSGDSSPERDHSPGSLSVAGSGRDTGGLAALPPAPTPPFTHGRVACTPLPHLRAERYRSFQRGKVSRAAPSAFRIRSDAAGLRMLALVAPLAHR